MTQPKFAPIETAAVVRPALEFEVPRRWRPHRPGEVRAPGRAGQPAGRMLGHPGPDAGYAAKLAADALADVRLAPGEDREDVAAGLGAIAMRRAADAGRGPVPADVEVALALWGFGARSLPEGAVEERRRAFAGSAHHEEVRVALAESVDGELLRLGAEEVWERALEGGAATG